MGRPDLPRETKFSGATGDREISVFPVQLTTSRIGNHIRLIHTLLYVMTIHTTTTTSTTLLRKLLIVRVADIVA